MTLRSEMMTLAIAAQQASRLLANLSSEVKNKLLCQMADAVEAATDSLHLENEKDLRLARQNGMAAAMIDRLTLTNVRISAMADGLR